MLGKNHVVVSVEDYIDGPVPFTQVYTDIRLAQNVNYNLSEQDKIMLQTLLEKRILAAFEKGIGDFLHAHERMGMYQLA